METTYQHAIHTNLSGKKRHFGCQHEYPKSFLRLRTEYYKARNATVGATQRKLKTARGHKQSPPRSRSLQNQGTGGEEGDRVSARPSPFLLTARRPRYIPGLNIRTRRHGLQNPNKLVRPICRSCLQKHFLQEGNASIERDTASHLRDSRGPHKPGRKVGWRQARFHAQFVPVVANSLPRGQTYSLRVAHDSSRLQPNPCCLVYFGPRKSLRCAAASVSGVQLPGPGRLVNRTTSPSVPSPPLPNPLVATTRSTPFFFMVRVTPHAHPSCCPTVTLRIRVGTRALVMLACRQSSVHAYFLRMVRGIFSAG